MLADQYYESVLDLLQRIRTTQWNAMVRASKIIADSLIGGGILHMFGSGHSHLLPEEAFFRSGGLAAVSPILDPSLMLHEGIGKVVHLERQEAYARFALAPYDLRAGEVIIIFSTSGKNAVPVEVCLEARRRGLLSIAVTSVEYSIRLPAQHSSGKRLFEVADLTVDNCCPFGDASVEAKGVPGIGKVGATSTIASTFIWHTVEAMIVDRYLEAGIAPPMAECFNTGEAAAAAHNSATFARYRERIRHL